MLMTEMYKSAMASNTDSLNDDFLQRHYPLHWACFRGNEAYVKELLVSGRADVYQEDGLHGWTPMHWAAYRGELGCLRELGHRPGIHDVHSSRSGETPTHIAAKEGHSECLHWLLQRSFGYGQQDHMGDTPLHKAAQSGHLGCVKLLLSHGPILSVFNQNGQTPLDAAAQSGHLECKAVLEEAITSQHTSFFPSASSPILMNGEGIYQNRSLGNNGDEMDQDMDLGEEMGNCGDSAVSFQPTAGRKRTVDHEEEMPTKRQRLFAPNREDKLGTVSNNNVLSSYQGVLAVSVEPFKAPSAHHIRDTAEGMDCTNEGLCSNENRQSSEHHRGTSLRGIGVCARREYDYRCSALRSHMI